MRKRNSNSNGRLYFEIKGRPGRIYLEGMSFGDFGLGVDGHSSPFVRSPANLFPEPKSTWDPLHRVLEQYYRNVVESTSGAAGSNLYETGFNECSISEETVINGRTFPRAKYRLLGVRVVDIYRIESHGGGWGVRSDRYKFEFDDYQRF